MANVGKLTVSLTTLSGRFGEGLREAGHHLHAFGEQARELGAKVKEAGMKLAEFGGIAEALSFGGIAYLTHEAAELVEKNTHLADSLGTSTEALLGMQYAAKEAGVGADEFASSMRHLEKELGNPSKEVNDALRKINLTAVGLMNQDPETQFKRIADGVSHLGTQSEKAAVAFALFGRQGVQLLAVLDEGGRGVDENIDKVKKLGAAFSRVDAAQVIEANHALEAMKTAFDAIFTKLAIRFAPFITEVAEQLLGLGKDGTSVADTIGDAFIDASRHMLRLLDIIDAMKGAFYGLGALVYKFIEGTAKIANFADTTGTKLYDLLGDAAGHNAAGDFFRGLANRKAQDAQHTQELVNDWQSLADKAFEKAGDRFRAAIDGERSMSAQKTFDQIIGAAHQRAADSVRERGERSAANTAAERKRLGEQIAKGFTDALTRSKKWAENTIGAARGAQLVGDWLHSGLAFMKTLPRRAFEAGWRPPVDVERTARGTFSGETASRMSVAYSVQERQLEETKKQTKLLEQLYDEWSHGVVLP